MKRTTKRLIPNILFLLTGFGMSTDGRSPCRSVYVWAEIQVVIELQKFAVLNGIFEGVSNIVSQKYMCQSFFRSRSDYVSLARLFKAGGIAASALSRGSDG
jgi:hypothetical protein